MPEAGSLAGCWPDALGLLSRPWPHVHSQGWWEVSGCHKVFSSSRWSFCSERAVRASTVVLLSDPSDIRKSMLFPGTGEGNRRVYTYYLCGSTCLVAQMVKHLSTMQETRVQSLGWEDPLEKEMAIHSITAWKIPWTEKPGRLQSMGSQRVGHN